jgi:hypothetical protein
MHGPSVSTRAAEAGAIVVGVSIAVVILLVVLARHGPTSNLTGNSANCSPTQIQNQSYYNATNLPQVEERCIAMNSGAYLEEEQRLPANETLVFNSIFEETAGGSVVSVNVAFTIYDSSGPFDCSGTSYGNFIVSEDPSGTAVVGSYYQPPMPCM